MTDVRRIKLKGKAVNDPFLPVVSDTARYSGGDQLWFRGTTDIRGIARSDFGSCGVIAAANVLAYMDRSQLNKNDEIGIITRSSYTKAGDLMQDGYMELANLLYDKYLTPFDINKLWPVAQLTPTSRFSLGIWPVSRFIAGVLSFSNDKGLGLKSAFIANSDLGFNGSLVNACGFIKYALLADYLVVIFVTHNKSARQSGSTDRHYMVITEIEEIYEKSNLVGASIMVGSWGRETLIDFKSIWNDSVFYRLTSINNVNFSRPCIPTVYLITFTYNSAALEL